MRIELVRVDPHDPAISAVQLARQVDELVRALNYSTRSGDPRLGDVPDAYAVLGALREALGKLPQACTQIAAGIHRHESGSLRAELRFPYAGEPQRAVGTAALQLRKAAEAASRVSECLAAAQSAISGISHRERPSRPERPRTHLTDPPTQAEPSAPLRTAEG